MPDQTTDQTAICGEVGTSFDAEHNARYTEPCALPADHDEPHDWAQREDALIAEGYAAAVARLRDDARYLTWWTSDGVRPDGPVRYHLADYLEAVGPDGPDVTSPRAQEPADVLERLHAEYNRRINDLIVDQAESDALRERMAQLLTGVANALKGEPGPLRMHDWSDLPAVAAAAVADRDKAREVPEQVADAAARLRQDIREAIDVCYGELGGEADTPEDVAGTERAIAHDMATVLDWIARGLQPQKTATAATDRSAP